MNTCHYCYKETKNPKFCSKSCSASYTGKKYPKRAKTKKCKICDELIHSKNIYCSKLCQSIGMKNYHTSKQNHNKSKSQIMRSFRSRIKIKSLEYLGNKCIVCGYNKCVAALEFHHKDPSTKEFQISNTTKKWETIKIELDKCVLLCANCHRELHFGLIELPKT